MPKILAFSSSRAGNGGYLETAIPLIKQFLGDNSLQIAFIPFASVDSPEDYFNAVKSALNILPHAINLITHQNAKTIIDSDVIMVGGGNSFKLLHDLYNTEVLELIRNMILAGTPYIGWSAGSNILSPAISTTNDMPVIQPRSFKSLGIFPFQINPHYYNQVAQGFNGETRDQRLSEFIKLNPEARVVGLPEGTALQLEGARLTLHGPVNAVLFHEEQNKIIRIEIKPGDVSYLLDFPFIYLPHHHS